MHFFILVLPLAIFHLCSQGVGIVVGHCVLYCLEFWSLALDHRVNFFPFFFTFSFPHRSPSLTLTLFFSFFPFYFFSLPFVLFYLIALLPHCLLVLPPRIALCTACCLIVLHCCFVTSLHYYLIASFTLTHCLFRTTLPLCHVPLLLHFVASSRYLFTLLCYLVVSLHNFLVLCAFSQPRYPVLLSLRAAIAHYFITLRYLLTPSPAPFVVLLLCWLVLPSSFFCKEELGTWRNEFSNNHQKSKFFFFFVFCFVFFLFFFFFFFFFLFFFYFFFSFFFFFFC